MLGFAAKKYEQTVHNHVSVYMCLGILILGIIETITSFLLFGNSITYFGSIMITVALLLLAIKLERRTYHKAIVKVSGYSMYIYVFHIAIGGVLQTLLDYLNVGDKMLWINTKPFIVFVLAIVLSMTIEYVLRLIRRKERNSQISSV